MAFIKETIWGIANLFEHTHLPVSIFRMSKVIIHWRKKIFYFNKCYCDIQYSLEKGISSYQICTILLFS